MNGERGTGNRERESGNECTAVMSLRTHPSFSLRYAALTFSQVCALGGVLVFAS